MPTPSPLSPDQLDRLLRERTRFTANRFEASCASTQDLAAAAANGATPPPDGVVWTDHQTLGRGRQQRSWLDEAGADVAATFRCTRRLPRDFALPACVPVVVAATCEAIVDRPVRIKWPNDVFYDGRKLSGVLIDAGVGSPDTYLIGIGINANRTRFPRELDGVATSLALQTGLTVDRNTVLLDLAVRLEQMLDELESGRTGPLLEEFRRRLGLLQRPVVVTHNRPDRGILTDLDFRELELDGHRRIPLGLVQGLRAAT